MMNAFKAVIFDMDGLMLDTETISQLAWQTAGRELSVDIPTSLSLQMIGLASKDIKALFRSRMGDEFPVESFINNANIHYHRLLREKPIPVKTGLIDLLDYLENQGIPKGVATSTSRDLAELKLESADLSGRFDCIVTGDEVDNGKPAPDIFLRTAQMLGVNPDECLVLEDSAMGIRGASAAGMKVIMIPDLIQPSYELRSLAYGVFDSLKEVLEKFRNGESKLPDLSFTPPVSAEDSPM